MSDYDAGYIEGWMDATRAMRNHVGGMRTKLTDEMARRRQAEYDAAEAVQIKDEVLRAVDAALGLEV